MKHKLFLFLAAIGIFLPLAADAETFEVDGIKYETTDETSVSVTRNVYRGDIVIPAIVNYGGATYSVTNIGVSAFSRCSGLTSITIPNSVTRIEYYAFSGCSGLTSITIPNSVTSIGNYAFSGCSGLTSITIPNSVTTIGSSAFSGCSSVKELIYADGCTTALRTYLTSITSITIPNSVTSIGSSAFSGCSGLTSITIPNSVTSIGSSAFSGCSGLTSVTIPNSVTSIGYDAFFGCENLKCVNIEDIASWCAISFGSSILDDLHLFIDGKEIKELIIPSSVTSIGNNAFSRCSGLTSITIPNSVTSIGNYAFSGCSGLTSITIPNSVTSIGSSAFSGCNAIKEVYAKPLVPPTYGDKTFDDNVCTTAMLYVPNTNNCFTRYSGKEGWNNFYNIVEYDMSLLDEDPTGKPCGTPTVAYKDGKLVFNCTTRGAEYHSNITAQDAGTGITSGSELKLAATYDISVYATAEGYARSASAYATLAFNLDGNGTEEEGIISVKASPVLINAEGGTLYVSGLTNATEVEYFTLEGRALGRSMVKDGCTMFTTDQPKGSTVIVTVNGRGAKVVVR